MFLFYERDADGRLIEETVRINEEKKYQYEYEKYGESVKPDNRLIRMKLPDNKTITYNYDNFGNITKQEKYAYTVANATPTGVLETITYTYSTEMTGNNAKRLISTTESTSSGTSTTNFSYDSAGNACIYRGNVIE